MKHYLSSMMAIASMITVAAIAEKITFVEEGAALATVCVPAGLMAEDINVPDDADYARQRAEIERRRLRDSVRDLIHYIKRMSGVELPLREGGSGENSGMLPIHIGTLAREIYGAPAKGYPYDQGWRLVVSGNGIGIIGESDLAASYALYEVLDRLGCRWYMPGELGEHIPRRDLVQLEAGDYSGAPSTVYRGLWTPPTSGALVLGGKAMAHLNSNDDFNRRNRQGGLALRSSHSLENHISDEQRQAHPEWCAMVGGKPHTKHIKWTREDVAEAIADKIIANLTARYEPVYSLAPADSSAWDEEEDPEFDTGDWDVAMNRPSKADRWMLLVNRIAELVGRKYPEVLFSTLIYVDYTRPPTRETVHPNVIPYIAPITYNRAKPMDAVDGQPWNGELLEIVEGWQKIAEHLGFYWYGYNLSETWAPNPFITKWGRDLPILFNKTRYPYWFPETTGNFETTLIGLYLGMRLSWNATLDPTAIVKELIDNFYGAAAEPMDAYWRLFDKAWVETPGDPGAAWGYRLRFTPEVMREARRLMDAALGACQTAVEYRRVEIANLSLRQFEVFMKLEDDLATGHFKSLDSDFERWWQVNKDLSERFRVRPGWIHRQNYLFGPTSYRYTWIERPHGSVFREAARIARETELFTKKPLRRWRYRLDREGLSDQEVWMGEGFDDSAWEELDATVDTLSSLGEHNYFGRMVLRSKVELPAVKGGSKVYLWLSRTLGNIRVFINGKPVSWIDEKGDANQTYSAYAAPVAFDISEAAYPNAVNTIAVLCDRSGVDELGVYGLIGPAVIYGDRE